MAFSDPASAPSPSAHGAALLGNLSELDEDALGDALHQALQEHFGFHGFRGCQLEVCAALVRGQSALVVMPTGAGKSLCYQLPGLLRGGTTLVISPLIALMEDQVEKLRALGLRAERIHSGRSRLQSRQTCRDYLDGHLDYLFIAPERLAVPRFGAFLARRPPVLIAVDEAHCISHWGHDFRPDYRQVGMHLERFAEVPVLALTATATTRVQDDIIVQLAAPNARRFIQGFRRENLAVEACEVAPGRRVERICSLLSDPQRRPAIVYVPTRKTAEETATALGKLFPAAAYHAGLPGQTREAVQSAFSHSELDVVVATNAFGMGIDKADVRTVVHSALPSSVEAYYQEIGRAGRDGQPARAILMHAFVDRRIQQVLFERSYPPLAEMHRGEKALSAQWELPEDVGVRARMEGELMQRVLEQLSVHGGAERDSLTGEVRAGENSDWAGRYAEQRAVREVELDEIARFPSSGGCRMCTLVGHFGDRGDGYAPCGVCDVCDPDGCQVRQLRAPSEIERAQLGPLLSQLRKQDGVAKGRLLKTLQDVLNTEGHGPPSRPEFERLVDGLNRAGLCSVSHETFVKDGETLAYQKVYLTPDGRQEPDLLGVRLDVVQPSQRRKGRGRTPSVPAEGEQEALSSADAQLAERIRAWRSAKAKKAEVPAYRVLTNRALDGVARARPTDSGSLLAIKGIGPRFLETFGPELLSVVADQDSIAE